VAFRKGGASLFQIMGSSKGSKKEAVQSSPSCHYSHLISSLNRISCVMFVMSRKGAVLVHLLLHSFADRGVLKKDHSSALKASQVRTFTSQKNEYITLHLLRFYGCYHCN
jgi:hypothetical protein